VVAPSQRDHQVLAFEGARACFFNNTSPAVSTTRFLTTDLVTHFLNLFPVTPPTNSPSVTPYFIKHSTLLHSFTT